MNKRTLVTCFVFGLVLCACSGPENTSPTADPSELLAEMYQVKSSWTQLADISDDDILNYPVLCEGENSGFRDQDNGMTFFADSMTGIQYFLGVTLDTPGDVSVMRTVETVDMELVLVTAENQVTHFTDSGTAVLSLPAGENAFGVIGYCGSGEVSIQIDAQSADTVTIDSALSGRLQQEWLETFLQAETERQ